MPTVVSPRRARSLAVTALAVLAMAGPAGCGSSTDTPAATQKVTPAATEKASGTLTVRDPWVKAADTGMTAAFGTLVNDTGADVTIESATSPTSPIELHTMSMKDGKTVMQPKDGGFVVKAGATHDLAPGGDHLMLMKPSAPVRPGDELSFTLALTGGGTVTFTAVAKPFAGAQESYAPGHS